VLRAIYARKKGKKWDIKTEKKGEEGCVSDEPEEASKKKD